MNKINIEEVIRERKPEFLSRYPKIIRNLAFAFIEKIMRIGEINRLLEMHRDKNGFAFIDELFDYLDFTYSLSSKDKEKIPSEGRLIIAANHPLGGLDALSILKAVREVRPDVKIIANNILFSIDNIHEIMLPYDIYSIAGQRENIKRIEKSLENEEAIIIFPAAEVSRSRIIYIKDGPWHKGAVFFARKFNAPVLPVFVEGKNSFWFYFASLVNKKLSALMLPHELFNKRGKTIQLRIGQHIPAKAFNPYIKDRAHTSLLKRHLYQIGKNKKGCFITEKNVVYPVSRKFLKKEIAASEYLGNSADGKKIYLVSSCQSPNIMREIGRLREVTFRKVGEGTGSKIDLDIFDEHYKHLILWDDNELEIAGAYRIGIGNEIIAKFGSEGFYTSTLFEHSREFFKQYGEHGAELGRSFIQKKYWNTTALDSLWQGIGAFLNRNPDVKYLFGPVSISASFPDEAKRMLVFFFLKWFSENTVVSVSKNRFIIADKYLPHLQSLFNGASYQEDRKILKRALRNYGYSIPPLYKHYTELTEKGGSRFLSFGVDGDFENCIDGLIVVDIAKIKSDKKERYFDRNIAENEKKSAVNF